MLTITLIPDGGMGTTGTWAIAGGRLRLSNGQGAHGAFLQALPDLDRLGVGDGGNGGTGPGYIDNGMPTTPELQWEREKGNFCGTAPDEYPYAQRVRITGCTLYCRQVSDRLKHRPFQKRVGQPPESLKNPATIRNFSNCT